MPAIGINCQDGAIHPADVADLRRFSSALVIAAWSPPDATLAVLKAAGVAPTILRLTQDPRSWAGWPGAFVKEYAWLCPWNEPDIDGPAPTWYGPVLYAWRAAGGKVVEPAWSDERKRTDDGRDYQAVSAHVYPRGNGAANLAAVRARANGRPIFITEAGDATAPGQILVELAALGVTEPVYLYTARALNAQAQPAYDLIGVPLVPPPPPK